MGKNKEWAPFSLWCQFTSFLHKLQLYLPHFKDTLGVMSLQHVLVTYHSVCTGQEISCWNRLHDSRSNKLLCVNWRIFVEIFVSATEFYCNIIIAPIQSDSILWDLLQWQNSVEETKIFTKILQYKQRNLSLRCVEATCCCNLSVSI